MWPFLLGPFIGAFIGWVTNWLAIRMIFRPYRPVRLPLLGCSIQGLIPKRQAAIAKTIGEVVEAELFSSADLVERLNTLKNQEKMIGLVSELAGHHFRERLPGMIPASLRDLLGQALQEVLRREAPAFFSRLTSEVACEMGAQMNISAMVEEKILRLNLMDLERLVLSVSKNELKHIEILGALLGFVIGLVQALLYRWLQ